MIGLKDANGCAGVSYFVFSTNVANSCPNMTKNVCKSLYTQERDCQPFGVNSAKGYPIVISRMTTTSSHGELLDSRD